MRRPESDHLGRPWRVHDAAREFELLDVWRFPVRAGPEVSLQDFLDFFAESQAELLAGHGLAAMLFRLRGLLGRVFRWDERDAGQERAGFEEIDRDLEEALYEIRNATVHALLHLGRVRLDERGAWAPQMAVYVRPQGGLGRAYMTLIGPFRHAIVYPAMMRFAERRWPHYAAEHFRADDGPGEHESPASRFDRALAAIDAVNAQDPNSIEFAGERQPKERVHAERASHWLEVLAPDAGELLRLAVRAHHLRRWQLPRSEYPEGRAGYHAWRTELQRRHAREATQILSACGYSDEETDRVSRLIRKRGLGRDPEVRHFEDALCLVFIEIQLDAFAAGHPEEQVVSILAKTLPKMSEAGRALAAELCASTERAALLERATARLAGGSLATAPDG